MPHHPLHQPVLNWFAANARPLPWRDRDAGPWGILVSEVMLQQTPVARVLPAWRTWMTRWPSPGALAADAPGEAVRAWGRLGYPRRALRLHEAATVISERHRGRVPDDVHTLVTLPGVGAYTAAAVASFAFGRRHPVVDTNVRRVHARAVSGAAAPAPALTAAETRVAARLLPDADVEAARWSAAVMELGALVCTARSPRCDACPVRDLCAWRRVGCPPPAARRRGQEWAGTDRQVRGRLLEVLRGAPGAVDRSALDGAWADAAQRSRCLGSLVADGLVEELDGDRFGLPRRHAAALPDGLP